MSDLPNDITVLQDLVRQLTERIIHLEAINSKFQSENAQLRVQLNKHSVIATNLLLAMAMGKSLHYLKSIRVKKDKLPRMAFVTLTWACLKEDFDLH